LVKVLDRLAYHFHVQAQDIGDVGGLPAVSRQAHDTRSSVADDIVSALPLIQNIGFVSCYRSYGESHSDSHGATSFPKVKMCAVNQH
jgi:hypothetical protein